MTEIKVPIKLTGWIVLKDLKVDRVEVSRDYEFGPIPYVSEYGDDTDVIVFVDGGDNRFEADVNVTQPVHDLIEQQDIPASVWSVGG